MISGAPVVYEFGPFRLHPAERLLLRDGKPLAVTPKIFDLLVAFVRDRGRAVPKAELLETVWAGTFVEEGSLTRSVSTLRQLLGSPDYIETVSKFGYRFTAPVREEGAGPARSMAVLPFTLLGASDAGYLSVGLADALIARLAQIRRIAVRPTSAVLRYADAPRGAVAAARELEVDLVLEGTIRAAGERLRVTAQLVSGSGAATWSGRFDAAAADLFAIEDALAEQIVSALGEPQQRLASKHSANAEAYRLYLKGRFFWNKRTPEALEKAIDYFRGAIDLDPQYAAAYCGLADSYLFASAADPSAAERARATARKALQIDDALGEAHTTLARIEMAVDWNWSAAEERFRRAIELTPDYATARQWRANLLAATGRGEEAIAEIERTRALDPLSPALLTASGWIHYMTRRYRIAVDRYREALEIEPAYVAARRQMAMAYERDGRVADAITAVREVGDPIGQSILAHAYAVAGRRGEALDALAAAEADPHCAVLQIAAATHLALGDRASALALLRRACDARASTLMWLGVDPWFDALRGDAEFEAILRRIGF